MMAEQLWRKCPNCDGRAAVHAPFPAVIWDFDAAAWRLAPLLYYMGATPCNPDEEMAGWEQVGDKVQGLWFKEAGIYLRAAVGEG
jgi:hypothetical protein